MEILAFLRAGGTLQELERRYAIRAQRHNAYPQLVSLKYNQRESPFAEALVRECRGIVLDERDSWRCVARPWEKFFNYGEPLAASIDWSTARVQEKLDGSLIILYWYADAWQAATTGTPDGGGPVGALADLTFADLFWRTFREAGLRLPERARGWTLLFELTAPENRVVVRHQQATVTLLGLRRPDTGQELAPSEAVPLVGAMPGVREFPLRSFDEVRASFERLDPFAQEGYVVVDARFHRVKCKHPHYVGLSLLKEQAGPKTFLDVIRRGETMEVLAAFPELRSQFDTLQHRYDALAARIEAAYVRRRAIESQKQFAAAAMETPFAAILFALRAKKVSTARAFLAQMPMVALLRLLDADQG